MGEIRAKSENLFDVTTVTNAYLNAQGVEHPSQISKTSDYIPVIANTFYTLGMTGTSSSLNLTSYCFYDSNKEFLSSDTYQPSTNGNIVSITTPNNCAYFRFTYNQLRNLVEFVRGVYNSFPPYFLNRPAHQVTNGQFVDIPTHHYTNGRWQGELTSQSPLRFRADGDMLDWRIEGKTSGNLFDIEHYIDTAIIHNMEITPIKNGIRLTSTSSNDPYCNPSYWGVGITVPLDMRKSLLPCKPSTKYTIMLNQTVIVRKIVSYVDENFTNIQNFTSFDGEVANIQTPENCAYIIVRIGNESTMPEGTTVEVTNIQLREGTYTSETIPPYEPYEPYEPYGGVGDYDETEQKYKISVTINGVTTNLYTDHQLMDGDSIDFTTTETTIPLATGNNTLTVDTAVQPKSVFVKFEG